MSPSHPTRRALLKNSLLLGLGSTLGLATRLPAQSAAPAPAPAPAAPPALPPIPPLKTGDYETLLLTWAGDPLTTMRVQWLEISREKPAPVAVVAHAETGGARHEISSLAHPFGPRGDLWVQRADLSGLQPGATYALELPGRPGPRPRFSTAPARLDAPLTFIEGGDVGTAPQALLLHAGALRENPLFAVVGGDLSYSDAKDAAREIAFYAAWSAGMVTPDGRHIPMIAAIGNHEVNGGFGKTRAEAPYFYALFDAWADPTSGAHGVIDFGDYLSLVILDSDHTRPVADQSSWLRDTLAARARVPHVFPVYHVPAYPSVRPFEGRVSAEVRQHWVPLFEASPQVRVAFEHHDHALKRTHPLRAGALSPADGVTYIGDGSWGRPARGLRGGDTSPFARREEKLHFWRVTLTPEEQQFLALDERGNRVDDWRRPLARA